MGGAGRSSLNWSAVLHPCIHRRMSHRAGTSADVAGVPDRVRRWCCHLHSGWPASTPVRVARSRMAGFRRTCRPCCSRRRPGCPRRAQAGQSSLGCGLHPCAGSTRDSCARLRHQPFCPARPLVRAGRRGDSYRCISRRSRPLSDDLPRLGTPLSRPEGPVRVASTTTEETRCPFTSCCRA